jgi:hypothetical protein
MQYAENKTFVSWTPKKLNKFCIQRRSKTNKYDLQVKELSIILVPKRFTTVFFLFYFRSSRTWAKQTRPQTKFSKNIYKISTHSRYNYHSIQLKRSASQNSVVLIGIDWPRNFVKIITKFRDARFRDNFSDDSDTWFRNTPNFGEIS